MAQHRPSGRDRLRCRGAGGGRGQGGGVLLRTPKGRGRRATRRRQQRAADREAEASRPRKRLLRLLVVDVHGVIVRPTDPREGLLLPVILGENPDVDPELLRDRHRKLVLGRLTPEEFWSDIGLGPIGREGGDPLPVVVQAGAGPAPVPRPGRGPGPPGGGRRQPAPGVGPAAEAHGRAGGLRVVVAGERRSGGRAARAAAVRGDPPGDVGGPLRLPSTCRACRSTWTPRPTWVWPPDTSRPSPEDVQETEHTLIRGFDDILRGPLHQHLTPAPWSGGVIGEAVSDVAVLLTAVDG